MQQPRQAPEAPAGGPAAGTTQGTVADAPPGNWVDRLAPAATRPYLRLSRADRPIGTWLLLIPCFWAVALAALADPGGYRPLDLWLVIGSSVGAFLMRGAGCTWNDITDREFDAAVARTRSRPIPLGAGQREGRGGLDGGAGAGRLAHPLQLQRHRDPAGRGLARPRLHLSLRQALHLVAAGLPRARLQLGGAAALGRPHRQPRLGTCGALCLGDRLDPVLRHDLRPSGQGRTMR